jgi:hypothetical protein
MLVTELRCCSHCYLRFRVPKDDTFRAARFYNNDYSQGFTTDLPTDDDLHFLLQTAFSGSQKDYTLYIDVMQAFGVTPGSTVFDFGCSWGYGSWQLTRAGYRVLSYDVSRGRAAYATQKLGCTVVADPVDVRRPVDCLFAAHVLEHLSTPKQFWDVARYVLSPGGAVVCFVPNGDPSLEKVYGSRRYHQLWGHVHPLMLDAPALRRMAEQNGYSACVYSAPYTSSRVASRKSDATFIGNELALLARSSCHRER